MSTIEIPRDRLEFLLSSIEKLASGDLSIRIPISESRDVVDAIAFGVNVLADEVQFRQIADSRRAEELQEASRQLARTLAELRDTQAQLVQSAKMAALGEFSSGLAHEINNPLLIIRAHTSKIQEIIQSQTGFQRKNDLLHSLQKVDQSISRMARTVKHVQDFSRRADDARVAINLNRVVDAAVELARDLMREKFQAKDTKLEVSLAHQPLEIIANFTAIEHVILNLLSNALDAIAAAGREYGIIRIRTGIDGDGVILAIQDNGCGIDAAVIDRIYEPFFTTKGPGQGTGIGLSISYRIVMAHHGLIQCHSDVGIGTEFTLHFPLASASE